MEWRMGEAWADEVAAEARAAGSGEQARERLFRLGAQALTEPELLCVAWGASPRAQGTHEEAEALLRHCGGLKALLQAEPVELSGMPGMGPRRAAQVLAALELGRRAQRTQERRPRLRTAREIHAYLTPVLGALRREVFHVLCFNARNVLVHDIRVAEGTMNMCPVDPREVFAAALVSRATAIVLAHNHPSGDPEPSVHDVGLTRHLVAGARLINVKVLDHLVVGDGAFVSMLERGLLPEPERGTAWEWNAAQGGG
ncbi:DNA repair protein RadC [Myxococcus stipitatus]|uniref:RadC family protein n=1 Tax=Myxococcus stipitatus TaxID=83455 RepID=UPI00314535C7